MFTRDITPPPPSAGATGRWNFGCFNAGILDPSFEVSGLSRFRLKEWHYTSVTTDECFFAFGIVQLGYVANLFVYFVDRKDPTKKYEREVLMPLGVGVSMAQSSISGTTQFRQGKDSISVSYKNGWRVELDVALDKENLTGSIAFEPSESLSVLFPLSEHRPAYTHKLAGMPSTGALRFRGKTYSLDTGFATVDWTRSLARRHTFWKWASIAGGLADGSAFGLNLSSDVYDDAQGNSVENAVFHRGKVNLLDGVRFDVPADPLRDLWKIRSKRSDEVDLTFEPLGARSMNLDLKVIRTQFVQPYGLYRGRVGEHKIDGLFGVVEDHDAIW